MAIDKFVQTPVRGEPPSIEWLALDCLMVDESYQRSMETPLAERLIGQMASRWDWRLCAPLTVSKREGGGLYVIDGQHRLAAARLRNDIPELPCVVSRFASVQEEARCFVDANTLVRKATPLDKFHARVVAGDDEAMEIKRVAESAGLTIGRSPYKINAGEIDCVVILARLKKQYGIKVLSAALVNVAEAWPNERIGTQNEVLPGLCLLFHSPPPNFDPDRFLEVLAATKPIGWYSNASWAYKQSADGWPDEVYRDLFLNAYLEAVQKIAA